MTKPVTLSDRAFTALRKEKKEGESDSDVVERLLAEANRARLTKNPFALVNASLGKAIPPNEHLRMIREWRDSDKRDAWAGARRRNGR